MIDIETDEFLENSCDDKSCEVCSRILTKMKALAFEFYTHGINEEDKKNELLGKH